MKMREKNLRSQLRPSLPTAVRSSRERGPCDAELRVLRQRIRQEGVRALPPQVAPLVSPGGVEEVAERRALRVELRVDAGLGAAAGPLRRAGVDRAERSFGDREAVVSVHQGVRKTFSQVKEESGLVAAGLLAAGLEPGDRLGIWGPNSYEWFLTQFAAAKAGLILVNINPAYRPSELEYCLNKVGVKGIVCDEKFKTSDGTFRFRDLYEAGESSHRKRVDELSSKIQFDSACSFQYTSGTTGLPKAAVLSHHQIVNNAYHSIGKRIGYGEKPHRICLSVPLYHCLGCVAGTICGMLYGATCVMPSAGFDPDAIVRPLEREKIASCYGTPTMFVDILNSFRKNPTDLSVISTGIMAGAPCPRDLVTAVNELRMKDLIVMYGMTETSPVTFQCFPSDPPEVRSSTIGFPGDHIEVKVVDESEEIVRAGEAGELLVRGYCNFLGYWDDPEKTREIMTQDRWLRTSDLISIQPDGYGHFIGRIKDMVIRGGENIYPAEIENFFLGHPDVIEAQVFGVPDARMGEEVATWIRKAEGSSLSDTELREWCKGKIAHYKVPRYVLFKDEFPRTVTGKIQKFKMREQTIEELNLKA
ncbi:medium-chain acyl-CoA ligase ACSF2, mitochondrial-like [Penaeus chinensis]|uniref:medium-chain acyl-CoA ligase ACSF2, mitochondrial-like n=1 Tax=Penaeus chinensis TaxID=139456 RepID=UPI001FB5CA97|nr:medium-chain acyl-CoA ligase ACSF2, mitochondrial-like [Penaeus chinensis]